MHETIISDTRKYIPGKKACTKYIWGSCSYLKEKRKKNEGLRF